MSKVPKDNIDLEKLGLVNQDLFEVSGDLAARYNKVLEVVFCFQSDLTHFRIDKRGLSPEVGDHLFEKYAGRLEYPENYLNMNSANRYMVVVSPDQRKAPLIAPQTSYDNSLCDLVHEQARHTIEDMTTREALYGELNEHVSIFRRAEDLLNVKTVEVSLDALNGTMGLIKRLSEMSERLGEGDNALNPGYIGEMQRLATMVGDIRQRMVSPEIFPVREEMHCFYAEFFGGVHCLRRFRGGDGTKTLFIHNGGGLGSELDRSITAKYVQDPAVIPLLHKYSFLKYNSKLVDQRIREVEDDVFLEEGIDVVDMSNHERNRIFNSMVERMPPVWEELRGVRLAVRNSGSNVNDLIEAGSDTLRLKLSEPKKDSAVIGHLLAELDPTDVVRVYDYNRRKFLHDFGAASNHRKRYIADILLKNKEGNN